MTGKRNCVKFCQAGKVRQDNFGCLWILKKYQTRLECHDIVAIMKVLCWDNTTARAVL